MKTNKHVSFGTSCNTKIFKINSGFPLKVKPCNLLNLAFGQACLHEHFCACQLYLKKPSGNQNIDFFDHLYEAILCDSHYVFYGLARGVSVVNFALSEASSKCSEISFFQNRRHSTNINENQSKCQVWNLL